jgi:MFS family permease
MNRPRFIFLNIGHAYDHLFMLLFPAAALHMEGQFDQPWGELLVLSIPGFAAFAAGAIPAGWLGDRWSRSGMMAIFFVGIGTSSILTGLARTEFEIAVGLFFIGLFASIYHPVGISMVVQGQDKVGRLLGINGVWGNMGIAAAAFVAAALSEWISWRAAFYLPGGDSGGDRAGLSMGFALLAAGRQNRRSEEARYRRRHRFVARRAHGHVAGDRHSRHGGAADRHRFPNHHHRPAKTVR